LTTSVEYNHCFLTYEKFLQKRPFFVGIMVNTSENRTIKGGRVGGEWEREEGGGGSVSTIKKRISEAVFSMFV
jgi:hypothetical protein